MAKKSRTVSAGSRVYYFDRRISENKNVYFTVTEMTLATGRRHCIFVHPEDAEAFVRAFCEVAEVPNVSKR